MAIPTKNINAEKIKGNLSINGVSATTISATTYLGLPIDVFVTGGTYNDIIGIVTFTNNSGGTFNVGGFNTGYTLTSSAITSALGYVPLSSFTDTFVTGGTYSNGTAVFRNNTGGTFNVVGFVTGDTYWTSGSTGLFSIKANNDSGLDATGDYSVAEGFNTTASGDYSHAEGEATQALGRRAHAEGLETTAEDTAHSEGIQTIASGQASHAEGFRSEASALYSHAEGVQTRTRGEGAHSEGYQTAADGDYSHSEGVQTTASSSSSHAEGTLTIASGRRSHAEGLETTASGTNSHSQGYLTTASGDNSFAGGENTIASGITSFIHSTSSIVTGDRSVVLGGQGLTGSTNDTVYVPILNVKFLSGGTAVNTVGIDSNGFLVNDNEFDFSLNFINDFTYPIILPYNWLVTSVDNPSSIGLSLSATSGTYTLGSNISAFTQTLTVSASTSGFINLNCRRIN